MNYFLIYSDVEWTIFNRREFFLELARQSPTSKFVVINRPAAFFPNILRPGKARKVIDCFDGPTLRQEASNLFVVRNLTLFHDHLGGRFFEGRGNFLVTSSVEKALHRLGIPPTSADHLVIWLYEQIHWPLAGICPWVKKRRMVWEIFDDYRLSAQGKPRPMWVKAEKHMLRVADHILTLTNELKQKYERKNIPVTVLGNGYCSHLFAENYDGPCGIENIPRPRIVYLGIIRDWIDFAIIEQLAEEFPLWSFVFVGPIDKTAKDGVQRISRLSNIYFCGPRDRKMVPLCMSESDVAIIPYITTSFTNAVKPIKIYEFLSRGTPVVTSTSADLKELHGAIYIANKNNFKEKLVSALAEKNSTTCKKAAEFWSWEAIIQRNKEVILGHRHV